MGKELGASENYGRQAQTPPRFGNSRNARELGLGVAVLLLVIQETGLPARHELLRSNDQQAREEAAFHGGGSRGDFGDQSLRIRGRAQKGN